MFSSPNRFVPDPHESFPNPRVAENDPYYEFYSEPGGQRDLTRNGGTPRRRDSISRRRAFIRPRRAPFPVTPSLHPVEPSTVPADRSVNPPDPSIAPATPSRLFTRET